MVPKKGTQAPEFALNDQEGKEVVLNRFKGQSDVVLYFYPKDDTPGCTVEACEFRDDNTVLKKSGAVVLGISPDDESSHQKFIKKFGLPFSLLCDIDKKVVKAYGVWVKKSMYGREYMGVARTTFIIGKDGMIREIFEKVKPQGHAKEVLKALGS